MDKALLLASTLADVKTQLVELQSRTIEIQKLEGPQGAKGDKGDQGPKGEQGDRGLDGKNGKDGVQGDKGIDGVNGQDGISVVDAKIDFDNTLILYLSNGNEINAGEITTAQAENVYSMLKNGSSSLNELLPSQIGNSGKYLTTDGTTPFWGTVSGGAGGGSLYTNLLFNAEFRINQRNAASPTATTNAYNYDRWYYDGTYLYQGVENINLKNSTFSISWDGSATCSYSLNTGTSASQNTQTYTSVSNGGQITISSLGSNNLWIRFSSQPLWAKLEQNTSPTSYIYRDHTSELSLCYRYYETITSYTLTKGAQYDSNGWVFLFLFKQPKRVTPTMSGLSYAFPRIATTMSVCTRASAGDGITVAAAAEL